MSQDSVQNARHSRFKKQKLEAIFPKLQILIPKLLEEPHQPLILGDDLWRWTLISNENLRDYTIEKKQNKIKQLK